MAVLLALIGAIAAAQIVAWEQRRPRPEPYQPRHLKEN